MNSLAIEPAEFGIVLSSFGIGYMLAQIPGGLLADKIGSRPILIFGPIIWACFTGITGLVSTITAFVIVRVLFGMSEGATITSIYKTIGDNFEPAKRSRATAMSLTAIAISMAFAGPFVSAIIEAHGWRAIFFWLVIPSLLASVIGMKLLPKHRLVVSNSEDPSTGVESSYAGLFRMPSLWVLSLAAVAFNIPYWGFIGWMPSYLALERHIEIRSLGMLASIPYVFGIFGMLLGGWVGTAFHKYCAQIIAACFLCAGVALISAYYVHTLAFALAGLSGTAFFLFAVMGPLGKVVLDLAPENQRAAFVGTYNTAGHLSSAFAPAIIGFMVSLTGTFASGFVLMFASLCVSALCLLVLSPFTGKDLHKPALPNRT
tara:strand:+ start:40106 stop:41224 length:1119 start_codon:yes stop_codon:yes gene_type:complete